jgi:hypothetical protein
MAAILDRRQPAGCSWMICCKAPLGREGKPGMTPVDTLQIVCPDAPQSLLCAASNQRAAVFQPMFISDFTDRRQRAFDFKRSLPWRRVAVGGMLGLPQRERELPRK